jgi:hypothetical protein
LPAEEEEADFRPFVFESGDDRTDDSQPIPTANPFRQSTQQRLRFPITNASSSEIWRDAPLRCADRTTIQSSPESLAW